MSKESPTRKPAGAGTQNRDRDKRFLGTIQSALGNSPNRNRKQREARTTVAPESEITLSDALEQISISNEDSSISLAGIKPIIRQKADQFTKDEFAQIAETLCQSAVEQTNVYFVLEICTELIEYENFQIAISECLTELVGKFLRQEAEEKFESIPSVLAQFMVNRWPRNFDKAIEGSNLVLFTIYSTIMGWIEFVKSQLKNDQQPQSSITENGENTDESNILHKSIQGILSVCMNGQRYLWLNYPELFNGIYDLTMEILVSNIILTRSVKSSLLMLYQQMGKWSQTNAQTKTPKYLNATTQTVR